MRMVNRFLIASAALGIVAITLFLRLPAKQSTELNVHKPSLPINVNEPQSVAVAKQVDVYSNVADVATVEATFQAFLQRGNGTLRVKWLIDTLSQAGPLEASDILSKAFVAMEPTERDHLKFEVQRLLIGKSENWLTQFSNGKAPVSMRIEAAMKAEAQNYVGNLEQRTAAFTRAAASDDEIRGDLIQSAGVAVAQKDGLTAANLVIQAKMTLGKKYDSVLGSVVSTWAQDAPNEAWFWVQSNLVNQSGFDTAVRTLVRQRMKTDSVAGSNFVRDLPSGEARDLGSAVIVSESLQANDVKSALAWLSQIKDSTVKEDMEVRVAAYSASRK